MKLEQERLDDGNVRLLEKVGNPHLIVVHWIVESRHRIGHFGDEYREQKDVGDVELPSPAQNLRRRIECALQREGPTIDEGGGIARNEDKDLRRVEELECLKGEIAEDVLWNMIDEDEDQSETAKKVEAEIARL